MPNDRGFARVELGYPVAAWFPVDVDDDGTWELAITVSGTPTRVGVFDPSFMRWVDGPRELPVVGDQWGVGDWNGDGTLEYAYRAAQSMRYYDPRRGLDSLLWTQEYAPVAVIVWGSDSTGEPLVGWLRYTGSYSCDTFGSGGLPLISCQSGNSRQWSVYGMWNGLEHGRIPGGLGRVLRVEGFPDSGGSHLAVYESNGYFSHTTGAGEWGWYEQSLRVVDNHWSEEVAIDLPARQIHLQLPFMLWGLRSADVFLSSGGNGEPILVFYVYSMSGDGAGAEEYVRACYSDGRSAWLQTLVNCSMCGGGVGRYLGVTAYDITGDAQDDLILPLAGSAAWEIRDPLTGSVTDTLKDMPRAELHTGPLLIPGKRDMFYVADSTLYVWMPDAYTAVRENEQSPVPDVDLALNAVPNPFNSAVRLSWSDAIEPSRLEIFNILGQRVREFDPSALNAASGIVWDGTDANGHSVPSGVYFARLMAARRSATVKIVLLK
ncbi:MAG: T9SS type A sorting domain-containing protein [Candidatus Zixiibacteriota bacterium]